MSTFGVLESPLLVGTVTTLVIFVAMFISYNANQGLPFVPVYTLTATAPSADGLVPGAQVLIGGRRVGFVQRIEPDVADDGIPVARLLLQLDLEIKGSVREDATVRVRPLSVFEYKYLDLDPGKQGRPLPEGAEMAREQTLPNVGLAETFSAFDEPTRRNLDRVLVGLGDGLAGRGAQLNEAFVEAADLLRNAQPVLRDLAAPRTGLSRFTRALARFTGELAPVSGALAELIANAETTFGALEAAGPELELGLEKLPPTIDESTGALAGLRPVLAKAADLTGRVEPVADLIPSTSRRVRSALDRTTPALRRVPALGDDLDGALAELGSLAADRPLEDTALRLDETLADLLPAVRHIAPYQTVCNYIVLAARNVSSTVSEGNEAGTWLRFYLLFPPEELLASDEPAPELHYNPYPHGAAPGQPRECEAGNADYERGRRIGNVPGRQPDMKLFLFG
jgi:virulence factor Mce-like protein